MQLIDHRKTILVVSPVDHIDHQSDATRQDIYSRVMMYVALGCRVTVLEFSSDKSVSEQGRYGDVVVYRFPRESTDWWKPYRQRGLDTTVVKNKLIEIIYNIQPTHLWFEYDYFAPLVRFVKKHFPTLSVAVRSHNYELGHAYEKWQLQRRQYPVSLRLVLIFYFYQWQIWRLECMLARHADMVYCISAIDQALYQKRFSKMRTIYMPLCVDYTLWHMPADRDVIHLVYLSSTLSNDINRSGLAKLVEIANMCADLPVVFHVTGVKKDHDEGIPSRVLFHGFVDNLSSFLDTMDGAIVPVSAGYGMKGKVYEVLQRGLPTILTTRSHMVMGGVKDETYLVADSLLEWKEALSRFMSRQVREDVGQKGRVFMLENFRKEYIIEQLKVFIC